VVTAVVVVFAGFFGLAVGSFLNVVVYRLPRHESLSNPPSRCPGCATPIAWRDNIPVLSWLMLRGRCRTCSQRISMRYPATEALVGAAFVAVALALR
jgi:leader peptidase (prepilin peptidase)/N-methyltransferase